MLRQNINSQLLQRYKLWSVNGQYHADLSSDHQYQNLIFLLQSCKDTSQTACVHGLMIKGGLENNLFPMSKLLALCSLQNIHYAASIFRSVTDPNVYMCNTMLRGYSISNEPETSLVLFNFMMTQSHRPDFFLDQFTFVSVLKSCACLLAGRMGIGIHAIVLKCGFDLFLNVRNALVHFYSVCSRIKDARRLFDEFVTKRDLVSWNTLIGGYLCVSQFNVVLELFRNLWRDGIRISPTTILGVLSAVGNLKEVLLGKCMHVICRKVGFSMDLNVASALISMYGKLGCIHPAHQVFEEIDVNRDIVLWNCLIDAYSKNSLLKEALDLIEMMMQNGLKPNSSTLVGVLSACSASHAYAVDRVHDYVEELHLELDLVLGTSLADMYSKCGMLEKAINVFDTMISKDVRSWTAMISSYGVHGQATRAIVLFCQMEEEGVVPNEVTFLAVLNSCSHGGLVMEGMDLFKKMVTRYGLKPDIEHYGCVIDLLGRAGLLNEAYDLIKSLPVDRDATAWRSLLAACRVYGNVDLLGSVEKELKNSCAAHPADSLCVIGAYAAAGMTPNYSDNWETEYQSIKLEREQAGGKEPGCSSLVPNN